MDGGGFFPERIASFRSVKLTIHLCVVGRLRMSGAKNPLPQSHKDMRKGIFTTIPTYIIKPINFMDVFHRLLYWN